MLQEPAVAAVFLIWATSPQGQSRASSGRAGPVPDWSLVPAIADALDVTQKAFRVVPRTDVSRRSKVDPAEKLLDHLVGAGEQGGWDGESQRLGRLHVD